MRERVLIAACAAVLLLALAAPWAWGTEGAPLWTEEGVGVRTTSANDARWPQITPDGPGGAIITWQDLRSGSKWDIYAQRVGSFKGDIWYLAEGCTGGDFETFVLVQNPGAGPVTVDFILQTSSGKQRPPDLQGVIIPDRSRRTFKLNDYVNDWDVSTKVEASSPVVCERAVYGGGRTWAHDSVGYFPGP